MYIKSVSLRLIAYLTALLKEKLLRCALNLGESSMAKNRSRRLRKKLFVDEFQELGFTLKLDFVDSLTDEQIDSFFAEFLLNVVEANGMGYLYDYEFDRVCSNKRGSVTAEQRQLVLDWLKARSEVSNVEASELIDIWYPENSIYQA